MHLNFLDFEQPIAELEAKIEELRHLGTDSDININEAIARLEAKSQQLTKSIFSDLTAAQIVQLARHPQRPHAIDYINLLFTEFDELHGDRHFARGASIIAGIARFEDQPVVVIGQEKGRKTTEKVMRNFGMPNPEDYRKALRVMKLAERFNMPVMTFIDTPGAYPGIGAEERNQSEAIARNLLEMAQLKTPIVCTVTGEGGSGGALAIGVGDRLLMLQYSIYSVISPEGCASILWRDAGKASEAAEALGVTAKRIKRLGLIDEVVEEPLGGAHRNWELMAQRLKQSLIKHLTYLQSLPQQTLLEQRYQRWMNYKVIE